MGESGVVLVHVERDQLLKCADRVERIQIQPLVFERPPPRFDERVGECDLRHGENSSEQPGVDQLVYGFVEVLDSAVGEQGWLLVHQTNGGAEKEFGRGARVERRGHFPREYAT